MVGTNSKSPQKRKDSASAGTSGASPKKAKISNNLSKFKNGTTPAKGNISIGKKNAASPKVLQKFPGTGAKTQTNGKEKMLKEKISDNLDRKKKGQFFELQQSIMEKSDVPATIKIIETRIAEIESREGKTKTAFRKLKLLKNLKKRAENGGEMPAFEGAKPANSVQNKALKQETQKKGLKKTTKLADKNEAKTVTQEVIQAAKIKDVEDDESDEEIGAVAKSAESSDEEASEEEDGVSDEEDEEEKKVTVNGEIKKTPVVKREVKKTAANGVASKNKRFVLFVGNLPFDATKEEVSEHFTKVGKIKDVRIPTEQKSKKPRGFAYVEVENEEAYEKALSLHHTSIKGRRINVLYSEGGNKKGENKKSIMKAKNFKLHAMRKQGQLAGSVKQEQKRSARRAKANKGA